MTHERTYDVTVRFNDTRITKAVHAVDIVEAQQKAIGIVQRHKAAEQAYSVHVDRRGA